MSPGRLLATLLWECGPFYCQKTLGCCNLSWQGSASHHSGGGEESPVSRVWLSNGARKAAMATCAWDAEESSQLLQSCGSQLRNQVFLQGNLHSCSQETPSRWKVSFQALYYFSRPNKWYLALSTQREGVISILINNATLIKHTWIH